MRLSVVRLPGSRRPPQLTPVLQDLARRLAPRHLQVQLVLADDACLRRLNRQFRQRDRTTDVLSFLYDAAPSTRDPGPHAEIYISMPTARRQARERRHALRCEVTLLTLHGLLHLQGHDHEKAVAARRMRSAEVPHIEWLRRRTGWASMEPLVPAVGTARG